MPELSLSDPQVGQAPENIPERSNEPRDVRPGAEAGLSPEVTTSLETVRRNSLSALYGPAWEAAGARLAAAYETEGPAAYERLASRPEAYGEVVGDASQAGRVAGALWAREQVLAEARGETLPGSYRSTDRGETVVPGSLGQSLPEVVVVGHQSESDRENFRPRAPYARYPALDHRIEELERWIENGYRVPESTKELELVLATYDAARYLGAPSMSPTWGNPVEWQGDQAMTVPYPGGTIYANDYREMQEELPHMIQYNDGRSFLLPILAQRLMYGDSVYDTEGMMEYEAHEEIYPVLTDWIDEIVAYNKGEGGDPYSMQNENFFDAERKLQGSDACGVGGGPSRPDSSSQNE